MKLWTSKKRGDKVSPKMGRPNAERPKCIDIKVRIDEITNEKLQSYCKANNIKRAEAIRQGIAMLLEK